MMKQSIDVFADSHEAMYNYINSGNNRGRHTARVIVIKNNRVLFDRELQVITFIGTNESYVEILWPEENESPYYVRYSNVFQVFKFENGCLIIEGENKLKERITITIE